MLRCPRILALLALASAPLIAADAFRNGQPCMDGLCIGDGLAEVAKIPWEPAIVRVPLEPKVRIATLEVKEKRKAEIEARYRGDLTRAMRYLAGSGFDQTAVPALKGLAVCEHRGGIAGAFVGKEGNPIKAVITLLPDASDPAVQRWVVTNIERHYVNAKTDAQKDAIRAEMDQVYAAAAREVKPNHGRYHMSGDRVYLTMSVEGERYDALAKHPLCAKKP